MAMVTTLNAKAKLGFVTGTCIKPPENTIAHLRWSRANSMIRSWILNAIDSSHVSSFMFIEDAKQLWDIIALRCGKIKGSLVYQLRRELTLVKQGEMNMIEYYNKLNKLWAEYNQWRPPIACKFNGNNSLKHKLQRIRCISY
ncbi:OLC1v1025230C1 [Oldenlandia corymbosa var. corymbosa]|uniref:OLC1v1025230C1 n=1 Tax=Oldenlandia corymbosa var. corymbosa TaxID=529605 RepID=A0AAV1C5N8_OLDCO|nr:OLC1v1025230C1 [Oldenlandia corymbosa var. corymbosa]